MSQDKFQKVVDGYAVIGNPIAQSKSPIIHGMYAQATAQRMSYGKIEAPLGGFTAARAIVGCGWRGPRCIAAAAGAGTA